MSDDCPVGCPHLVRDIECSEYGSHYREDIVFYCECPDDTECRLNFGNCSVCTLTDLYVSECKDTLLFLCLNCQAFDGRGIA